MIDFSAKDFPKLDEWRIGLRSLALAILLAQLGPTSAFGAEPTRGGGADTVAPGMRVEVERTLVIEGGAGNSHRQLSVSPRRFDSWQSLFAFLHRNLGAKLIRDDTGELIGASGSYSRSGKVIFEEGGEQFDSRDYVASYLGGRSGIVSIGDEQVTLKADAAAPDDIQQLRVTDCVGESCIAGETWVTHAPLSPFTFYHSVGGRTTQLSGGYVERIIYYCSSGTLVGGQRPNSRCRVPDRSNCELELPDRVYICTGGDEYILEPSKTRREQVLSNVLTQTLRIKPGSATVSGQGIDTLEIEKSSWTLFRDFRGDWPLPIQSIEGICGNHTSSAGGNVDSWAGDTGPSGNCTGT